MERLRNDPYWQHRPQEDLEEAHVNGVPEYWCFPHVALSLLMLLLTLPMPLLTHSLWLLANGAAFAAAFVAAATANSANLSAVVLCMQVDHPTASAAFAAAGAAAATATAATDATAAAAAATAAAAAATAVMVASATLQARCLMQ